MQRAPIHRPSINPLGEEKAGGEQELAEVRNGHHATWCPAFFNTHSLLHFPIWKQLARQDSASVLRQLVAVFFERGPLNKLLTDNNTAFCSREFRVWSCCVHAPAGDGIAKQCHHTVKQIAPRMCCSIQKAVYWHNMTLKDDNSHLTTLANVIY